MTVHRHFLGWDKPVLHLCADLLKWKVGDQIPDLRDLWVVVPTRHAGRRLREALAARAASSGQALLPPRVLTPEQLLANAGGLPVADRYQMQVLWVQLLRQVPDPLFEAVFSTAREDRDFGWFLSAANGFIALQDALGENGLTVGDAQNTLAEMDKPERWAGLAAMEELYLGRVAGEGLQDRNRARLESAKAPSPAVLPRRILVAAVPDPVPLALQALEWFAARLPVDVYVHAPSSLKDGFDEWGRPLSGFWKQRLLPIEDESIYLCAAPADQARLVAHRMTSAALPASDVAFGVPDSQVVPFLESELEQAGVPTYNPSGQSLANHAFVHLLGLFGQFILEPTFDNVSALARHPDWLVRGARESGVGTEALLVALDRLQAEALPASFHDLQAGALRLPRLGNILRPALDWLQQQQDAFESETFAAGVLGFLASVYEGRDVNRLIPEQRVLVSAASEISSLSQRFDQPFYDHLEVTAAERMTLFGMALGSLSFYPERPGTAVDLVGWLELHWDDAPFMAITGMNESKVPDSIVGHPFLPDSARSALGLKDNAGRAARDAYLLEALHASRKTDGELQLFLGKTSSDGDPLKPSRLLFHCDDGQLPARAKTLFGEAKAAQETVPRSLTWQLQPEEVVSPDSLSITSLRGYLACPFRFYLSYVLGMGTVDDRREEMDPMQFGSCVHAALEAYAASPGMRDSTNVPGSIEFLQNEAEGWMARRFGKSLSAALLIQREAMHQRLGAAAFHLVEQRRQGWSIVHWELPVEAVVEGVTLRGKVDRVDRHDSGRYRILDYKTSDQDKSPAEVHLRRAMGDEPDWMLVASDGVVNRWNDLQLPLYVWLLKEKLGQTALSGYFHLPKAVTQTGVSEWEGLGEAQLEAAVACAAGICRAVKDGLFWPPAEKVKFDDFQHLFFGRAADCVQWEGES